MSKLIPALVVVAAVGGSFLLGRYYRPGVGPGAGPGKKRKGPGKAAPSKEAPAKGSPASGAKERIAALVESDPEIAKFAKANPALVAKALKDPSSVTSDPKFLMWAATHGAQVAAIQEAARGKSLAIPAGPAAEG